MEEEGGAGRSGRGVAQREEGCRGRYGWGRGGEEGDPAFVAWCGGEVSEACAGGAKS